MPEYLPLCVGGFRLSRSLVPCISEDTAAGTPRRLVQMLLAPSGTPAKLFASTCTFASVREEGRSRDVFVFNCRMGSRKRVHCDTVNIPAGPFPFSIPERSTSMPNPIKRIELTPSQAAEKELILDQIRENPRGPWINGRKVSLPRIKVASPRRKKK